MLAVPSWVFTVSTLFSSFSTVPRTRAGGLGAWAKPGRERATSSTPARIRFMWGLLGRWAIVTAPFSTDTRAAVFQRHSPLGWMRGGDARRRNRGVRQLRRPGVPGAGWVGDGGHRGRPQPRRRERGPWRPAGEARAPGPFGVRFPADPEAPRAGPRDPLRRPVPVAELRRRARRARLGFALLRPRRRPPIRRALRPEPSVGGALGRPPRGLGREQRPGAVVGGDREPEIAPAGDRGDPDRDRAGPGGPARAGHRRRGARLRGAAVQVGERRRVARRLGLAGAQAPAFLR